MPIVDSPSKPGGPRGRAGISSIEALLAVAAIAILLGAAVPATSRVLSFRAGRATRSELEILGRALESYVRDVGEPPSGLIELMLDPGNAGWDGPYVDLGPADRVTGMTDRLVDGWSRPYRLVRRGERLVVASPGGGAAQGLSREVDLDALRTEMTRDRMRVLNVAIVRYNGEHQMSAPLPADFGALRRRLVATGFLVDDPMLRLDAWGDPFVEDPEGSEPVVRVTSTRLIPVARLSRVPEPRGTRPRAGG